MPDIGYAEYLVNYLIEIGFAKNSGFGLISIDWTDLHSWSSVTNTTLTNWECLVIMLCSRSYVDQFYNSNEKIVPAPFQPAEIDRPAVADRVGSVLRSMMKSSKTSNHGTKEKTQTL